MVKYCTQCGFKNEHKAMEKPNFCAKCGFNFSQASGGTPPPDTEAEEIETSDSFGNISKLDFSFEEERKNIVKFGEAVGSTAGTDIPERPQIDVDQFSQGREQQVEQLKRESETLRSDEQIQRE